MSTPSEERHRWRAPRWLLIIGYLVTILVPFFGQAFGFLLGVVLIILPHRRLHGVLLIVLSIVIVIVWLYVGVSVESSVYYGW